MAEDMIDSGKAIKKMREIIDAQGGEPAVKPEDLPIGPESAAACVPGASWQAFSGYRH